MAASAASFLAIPTSTLFHNPITHPPQFNCLNPQFPVKSFCLKLSNPDFSVSATRFFPHVKFPRASQSAITASSSSMQQELELGNTITTKNDTVLLVGVTGGTGSSVLSGLLASGVPSSTLCVLTRNPTSDAARSLASRGVRLVAGDLDDASTVDKALEGERHLSEFWFSEFFPSKSFLSHTSQCKHRGRLLATLYGFWNWLCFSTSAVHARIIPGTLFNIVGARSWSPSEITQPYPSSTQPWLVELAPTFETVQLQQDLVSSIINSIDWH